jgi:hypothetical protein
LGWVTLQSTSLAARPVDKIYACKRSYYNNVLTKRVVLLAVAAKEDPNGRFAHRGLKCNDYDSIMTVTRDNGTQHHTDVRNSRKYGVHIETLLSSGSPISRGGQLVHSSSCHSSRLKHIRHIGGSPSRLSPPHQWVASRPTTFIKNKNIYPVVHHHGYIHLVRDT